MPLLPIRAGFGTTDNDLALWVEGNDLIKQPGTAPVVGVLAETIEIEEQGPGAVSGLHFTVEDPGTSAPLPSAGATVLLWDLVHDVALFRGTVDRWAVQPRGVGRLVVVDCTGLERNLDALITADYVIPAGQTFQVTVAELAGLYVRANNIARSSSQPNGDFNEPVGMLGSTFTPPVSDFGMTIPAGITFRQAVIQAAATVSDWFPVTVGVLDARPPPNVTLDWYGNLRLWNIFGRPTDWSDLTIVNTAASSQTSAGIKYDVHPGDVVREVYVKGATPAVSGWYSDGTGIAGREAYISDSTLDTVQKVAGAARAYLQAQSESVRGSLELDPFDPPTSLHAGVSLLLTDASLGLISSTKFAIATIRKRFPSGKVTLQQWTVDFGARKRSAMGQLRNLTRATMS